MKYIEENLNLELKISDIMTSNWEIVNDICNVRNISFHAFPNALVGLF